MSIIYNSRIVSKFQLREHQESMNITKFQLSEHQVTKRIYQEAKNGVQDSKCFHRV